MGRFKTLAEAEAYAASLEQKLNNQNAISIVIYSNCGVEIPSKKPGGKPTVCKVDPATFKCIHGGEPKGNIGLQGVNSQFPVTLWGTQWLRAESFIADVMKLVREKPDFFQRPRE